MVVNVWIKNKNNEFLISGRAESKPHPLMWETTGDSVLLGEEWIDAAVREAKEELDAYLLGVFDSVERYKGKCIAVIHRTNDDDDKLIVVPDGVNYTDDQIRALTEFQERFFESVIIRC